MKVITRSGTEEDVKFDLITEKIKSLARDDLNVDPIFVAQTVCSLIHDRITTSELDDFTSSFAAVT